MTSVLSDLIYLWEYVDEIHCGLKFSNTNLKENATFNRYYLNSCKNMYRSHHREDLRASLSTMKIKRGMYHPAFCILLNTLCLAILAYHHL